MLDWSTPAFAHTMPRWDGIVAGAQTMESGNDRMSNREPNERRAAGRARLNYRAFAVRDSPDMIWVGIGPHNKAGGQV